MKHLLTTVALLVAISGCDGSTESDTGDVPDGGSKATDAGTTKSDVVVSGRPDAMPGYPLVPISTFTAGGVLGDLGKNPCVWHAMTSTGSAVVATGWYQIPRDPRTSHCYPTPPPSAVTSGVCGAVPKTATELSFAESHSYGLSVPVCGTTYAPGTLLIWDSTDPRFRYLGNPSGGYLCLPNNTPYVVPC